MVSRRSVLGGKCSKKQRELRSEVIRLTTQTAPPDATYWSCRSMARQTGTTHSFVGASPIYCDNKDTTLSKLFSGDCFGKNNQENHPKQIQARTGRKNYEFQPKLPTCQVSNLCKR